MRFDSFNDVASWYERTKPMVSKFHTKRDDIRPIGDRARKWERIKKIDDNTYALLDGLYGHTMYGAGYELNMAARHTYENMMAPIVWMRREDGDFIRIRNNANGCSSVARYKFLQYQLPSNMSFTYGTDGRHFVNTKGKAYYLPKSKVKFDYNQGKVATADDVYLTFRANDDGTFTHVGNEYPTTRKVVDREAKRELVPYLNEFYEFCGSLAPLFVDNYNTRIEYRDQIRGWMQANVPVQQGNTWWRSKFDMLPVSVAKGVVMDRDHPLRVAAAYFVVVELNAFNEAATTEELKRRRAAYNRIMNKALGLTVEVER